MIIAKLRESHIGALLTSTYLLYSLVFWAYPFIWLIILSFSDWRFIGAPSFTGIDNFFIVFQNREFWNSMWNVVRFFGFYLPIVFISSLAFAFGLKRIRFGKTFVALSFLLANVSSGVAYSLVFSKIFSTAGPVNLFLSNTFGITIPWFSSPNFAMLSISLVVTWKFVGYYGLILYSGLVAIPAEVQEAATLDKVGPITRLFRITLPMINAQLVLVFVLAVTIAFGVFTEAYLITGGGPLESTNMPMVVMYETALNRLQPTRAALMSIIVAIASYAIIKLFRKLFEKDVELS
jgi:multiple sugar transport system permease protein